jgi:arylsulfatase
MTREIPFGLTFLWLICSSVLAADKPLNVVVLFADDWRHDTLGCAGNLVVKTPHLDALASEGVRFTNNYVTTSICGVSRASLLTGQWMSRHGNRAFAAFDTPWKETYPGILRDRGYFVGHIGKWHNGKFPSDEFDVGKSYSGTHWIKQPDGSKIHVTQKNEKDALEFLRTRPSDKPFCLTLAFFATHAEDGHPDQYLPQPSSMSLYTDVSVPVPKTASDAYFKKLPPFIANEKNEGRNRWHWRFDTPERYQTYMKNYYRLATEVDTVCGRVVAELKSQGTYDNTLVIFTTDNGYFHAEHGLADKWYPYEESIRVPLIVHDPRMPKVRAGSTHDAMTLNVDLAPTILAATNSARPARMQGQDFAPLYISHSEQEWRQDYFYEHGVIKDADFIPPSEALVGKDWKYILWPDSGYEQLFDLKKDPLEENDLAKDPSFRSKLESLKVRFQELKSLAK